MVNDTQLRVCFFYDEKRPIEFDPYPGENNTTKFAACNQSETHHGNHADVMEFDPNVEKTHQEKPDTLISTQTETRIKFISFAQRGMSTD